MFIKFVSKLILVMYDYIKGQLDRLTPAAAVVEAGGVGYYINISLQTFSSIESATEVKLYTHFIVREDAQVLYGFYTLEEREVFRALIGVSGVGGNTARMILSTFSSDEVRSIIATGQADVLKSVKGLGIKTAQKLLSSCGINWAFQQRKRSHCPYVLQPMKPIQRPSRLW